MTKHAPATPLPWSTVVPEQTNLAWHCARFYRGERLVANIDLTNGPSGEDGGQTLHYIDRACRAYPRLVEALRQLLDPVTHKPVCIRDASALLRELGEE